MELLDEAMDFNMSEFLQERTGTARLDLPKVAPDSSSLLDVQDSSQQGEISLPGCEDSSNESMISSCNAAALAMTTHIRGNVEGPKLSNIENDLPHHSYVNLPSIVDLRTPLHEAVLSGYESGVRELLYNGAKVNVHDMHGFCPLHYSVHPRAEHLVCHLLRKGSDPNLKTSRGHTPLHLAIMARCSLATVDSLLNHGALVNTTDSIGRTPLFLFAEQDRVEGVLMLLRRGADTMVRALHSFNTALDEAAMQGYASIVRALLRHGHNADIYHPFGHTALHWAANCSRNDMIQALLEGQPDLEALDLHGLTPLHVTVLHHNCGGAFLLLQHGAHVNSKGFFAFRPLHLACFQLRKPMAIMVDLLLRWGADERALDDNNNPAHAIIVYNLQHQSFDWEEAEQIINLFAKAAVNRAWRQRRLIILCRARIKTMGLKDSTQGQMLSPNFTGREDTRVSKVAKFVRNSGDDQESHGVGGTASNLIYCKREAGSSTSNDHDQLLVVRLVVLGQEDVFRHVVYFL